jgi:hypothetical protein
VFGYEILTIKYNFDSTFFINKSYFIQLFKKQIIFYSTFYKQIIFYSIFSKKSSLKIRKRNKNLILISKIHHSSAPSISFSISAIIFSSPSLCFSTQLNLLWGSLSSFFFFFFFSSSYDLAYRMHLDVAKRVPLNIGGTPIALRRFEKNFVSKERMFVTEKQIKNNKIKRAL